VKTNAPSLVIWVISVILGVLGILLHFGIIKIATLTPYIFWLVAVAFILLALASILRGV
jgi:hypothetical protein